MAVARLKVFHRLVLYFPWINANKVFVWPMVVLRTSGLLRIKISVSTFWTRLNHAIPPRVPGLVRSAPVSPHPKHSPAAAFPVPLYPNCVRVRTHHPMAWSPYPATTPNPNSRRPYILRPRRHCHDLHLRRRRNFTRRRVRRRRGFIRNRGRGIRRWRTDRNRRGIVHVNHPALHTSREQNGGRHRYSQKQIILSHFHVSKQIVTTSTAPP